MAKVLILAQINIQSVSQIELIIKSEADIIPFYYLFEHLLFFFEAFNRHIAPPRIHIVLYK